MKRNNIFLSIIVPVFNEEKTIVTIVKRILKKIPSRSEIIIVDDGSTDSTPKLLSKFKANRKINIYTLKDNRGKGYAVRFGLKKAKGNLYLIQDADLEYNPNDYPRLLQPIKLEDTQVVFGSRLSKYPFSLETIRTIPLPLNFIANKMLSFLTNLFYGSQLTDMETCYKVFTRKVYNKLNLTKDGFDIEPEITVQIIKAGFTIKEVPIETKPRSYKEGKKITWKDGVAAFLTLFQYRFNFYHLAVILVLVLATLFRFWDFPNRYGLWSDQARDALVGRVSVDNRSLPLIGSFSSAGPFTFGPYWYWYSALMSIIFSSHMGYWIGTSIASLVMIALLMWITKKIGTSLMSILVGLLTAISFSQLQSSLGSTQHSMVAVMVVVSMVMAVKYLEKKQSKYLFLTGLFLSLAINFHYQAMYLIPMFLILIIISKASVKDTVLSFFGFTIPFIPLLVFDLQHNWWNLKNALDYYRFGQYRIYVPNRWLTYAGIFWPSFWAKTVGGHRIIAYGLMIGIGILFIYQFFKRKLNKPWLVFGFGFLAAIVWYRYFRGERFDGYVVYSIPLIILFSSWFIDFLIEKSRKLGSIMLVLVIIGSLTSIWNDRSYRNIYAPIMELKTQLVRKLPSGTYTLYDKGFITSGCSISLSLVLDDNDLSDDNGAAIGVCDRASCPSAYKKITEAKVGEFNCQLIDLTSENQEVIREQNWVSVSPQAVQRMTVEWWKDL